MKIGVVSDTHNQLGNVRRIVELLNGAGVERVVHTGDITEARTLAVLAELEAPLVGVYGNNDVERDALQAAAARFGFTLSDPPLELVWAERRILVVHDPRDLPAAGADATDLALHGHTHRRAIERRAGRLLFNPGECAGQLAGHNAVGLVDLATLEPHLLRF
jgi:putative phosphoesterase